MNYITNKKYICDRLLAIINNIANINITDMDCSLFSLKYNLPAESMVYILLIASNVFQFKINDRFIESLNDYSYNNIVNSIINQISISQ